MIILQLFSFERRTVWTANAGILADVLKTKPLTQTFALVRLRRIATAPNAATLEHGVRVRLGRGSLGDHHEPHPDVPIQADHLFASAIVPEHRVEPNNKGRFLNQRKVVTN